jgi:hypothetical protein
MAGLIVMMAGITQCRIRDEVSSRAKPAILQTKTCSSLRFNDAGLNGIGGR